MEISFETDSSKGSWSIPTLSILRSFNLSQKDILGVRLAYYALSNYPYEEVNVARCSHPCEGSIGFYVDTRHGQEYLIEEIFFYDYNLGQNHLQGLPHWNHERRLNDGKQIWRQDSKRVENHWITDSPSITLRITDKGSIINEKVVKRVSIDQVKKIKLISQGHKFSSNNLNTVARIEDTSICPFKLVLVLRKSYS